MKYFLTKPSFLLQLLIKDKNDIISLDIDQLLSKESYFII